MRSKPRKSQRAPFKDYARPKWWHELERDAVKRRCKGPDAMSQFDAVLRWHYGDKRTPEEVLWFGPSPLKDLERALFQESPFFSLIKKERP